MRFFDLLIKGFALTLLIFSCGPKVQVTNSIRLSQPNYPVLIGKDYSPVLRIGFINASEDDVCLGIKVNLEDTPYENIEKINIFYTGEDSLFRDRDMPFSESEPVKGSVKFQGNQQLKKGKNFFWVTYKLRSDADLLSKIDADLEYVNINGIQLVSASKSPKNDLRLGVAVRQHMDDNVHTYRIPGLATTNEGTLLAIYDVRREHGRDLQGHMDIGVSRSVDQGQTWEPMRIAMDMGEWGGLPQKYNGVSDANILVDKNSDNIYLAGLWMHGVIDDNGEWIEGLTEDSTAWNHQWRTKGSQPGFGVKETSQFLVVKSNDDGNTWSEPVNLTKMCKKEEWWLWAPAPGSGITLDDGTLVFPTQGRDKNGETFSNITYSRDGGITWKTSKPAYHNTTENMAVQLSDGSIMLNMRDNRNRREKGDKNGRAIAVSTDLGETWTEHATSHGALVESVCMAAIHKHVYVNPDGKEQTLILFSNPNSKFQREKMTLKVSRDDGKTWPEKYWMELDEGHSRGYSCMTTIDNDHIGIIYEGSLAHLVFQKIAVAELLGSN
jgi:sialidase-1